jgi:preprotein translocase subunit SecD
MVVDPRRRVIAFDLPGHGESSAHVSYDVDSVVASLHRAVEEAEVKSPVVVGESPRCRAPLVASTETLRARRLIEHRDQSAIGSGWRCRQ